MMVIYIHTLVFALPHPFNLHLIQLHKFIHMTESLTDFFYFVDVFRQCGGARCAHNLVPYEFCRRQALSLVKQLLLSSGGDDDMGTLLALMQKEPHESILIKVAILRVSFVVFQIKSCCPIFIKDATPAHTIVNFRKSMANTFGIECIQ